MGGAGSPSNTMLSGLRPTYQVASWSIMPFGYIRHGPKSGCGLLCPFLWGELGPHLTQYGLGQGLSPYQVASWSIRPFGHNTPMLWRDRQDNGPIASRVNRFTNGWQKTELLNFCTQPTKSNSHCHRHKHLCFDWLIKWFTQFNRIYLDWNLLQANRVTAVLMTPIWLSHVSLIRITNCAAFNKLWGSLHTYICDNTQSTCSCCKSYIFSNNNIENICIISLLCTIHLFQNYYTFCS